MVTFPEFSGLDLHEKTEAVAQRCSVKRVFLKISQNSQENTCATFSFVIKFQAEAYNFNKKDTLEQVFSSEFCEISKNAFFIEHLRWLLLKREVFPLFIGNTREKKSFNYLKYSSEESSERISF